jgi:hypothetical protein
MTGETKWTPGPWHACKSGNCKCGFVSCDDYPVAKVTRGEWGDTWPSIRIVGETSLDLKAEPFMDGCMYGSVNDETAIANAKLIAAAPDMAEALRPFAALCDEIERAAANSAGDASDPNNWAKSCSWEDLLQARAAIRSAMGNWEREA